MSVYLSIMTTNEGIKGSTISIQPHNRVGCTIMLLQCGLFLALTTYASALYKASPLKPDGSINDARLAGGTSLPSLHFMVNILEGPPNDPTSATWICQGVVIAENVTLTAASCLYDVTTNTFIEKENLYLINGKKDKTDLSSTPIGVSEVVILPTFKYYPNSKMYGNDLAMLIPKSNFPITSVVLLDKKANYNTKDIKLIGGMVSWGSIGDGEGNAEPDGQDEIQGIYTNFRNHKICAEMYATFRKPLEISPHHLCLNNTIDEGVCMGDAGAPVTVPVKGKDGGLVPSLIGIASKVHNDICPPDLPSVVSRVAPHLLWISTKTGKKVV